MMRNCITLMLLWGVTMMTAQRQMEFSARIGYSPGQSPVQAGIFVNRQDPFNEFYFNVVQVKPQRFAGIGIHSPLNENFFLEVGVTYTRHQLQYLAQYTYPNEIRSINTMVINETNDQLLIPLDIGTILGPVEITSGLKLIAKIKSDHEFSLLDGFSEVPKMINMGWQMGARVGINGIKAGVEFNGTLRRTCEDRFIHSNPISIRHIPGQFMFYLQFRM